MTGSRFGIRGRFGIRAQVMLLVFAIAAPLATLVVVGAGVQRNRDRDAAIGEVRRVARDGAVRADGVFDRAEVLLETLAGETELSRPTAAAGCAELRAQLERQIDAFTGLFAIERDGTIVCSAFERFAPPGPTSEAAAAADGTLQIADLEWLAHVLAAPGEPHLAMETIDPATLEVTLLYGIAVGADRIVAVGVRPATLADIVDLQDLPVGALAAVLDGDGNPISTRGGEPIPPAVFEAIRDGAHTIVTDDVDGAPRVYGIAPLAQHDGPPWYVVGYPEATLVADAQSQLRTSLLLLAVAAGFALALGLTLAELLVVRPVRRLRDTARALTDGDLDARAGLRPGTTELGELSTAFDLMADSLAGRTELAEHAAAELRNALDALEVSASQRARLLGSFVRAQEAERRRIAYDLHDDTVQVLAALGMRLGQLRHAVTEPAAVQLVDDLTAAVTDAGRRLRLLLFELRPPALDTAGLDVVLREIMDQILPATTAGTVEWRVPMDELDEATSVVLYRVACEALANVAAHAQARTVEVTVERDGAEVRLTVADDGRGFEPASAFQAGHLGLVSMRERVELLGGTFELIAAPGGGTRVIARVRPGTDPS